MHSSPRQTCTGPVGRRCAYQWYRLITDSVASGYTTYKSVKRISPQFIVHNSDEIDATWSLSDEKVAMSIRDKMLYTRVNYGDKYVATIPIVDVADRRSGYG